MELSTNRVESASQANERSFGNPAQQRQPRRLRQPPRGSFAEDELLTETEESGSHQVDDIA